MYFYQLVKKIGKHDKIYSLLINRLESESLNLNRFQVSKVYVRLEILTNLSDHHSTKMKKSNTKVYLNKSNCLPYIVDLRAKAISHNVHQLLKHHLNQCMCIRMRKISFRYISR